MAAPGVVVHDEPMSDPSVSGADEGRRAPRSIETDRLTLTPPEESDVGLVARLMDVPADDERPADIVAAWRDHWEEHGYGTWIVRDPDGGRVGFVGLRDHEDFIRLTVRTIGAAGEEVAVRAVRRVAAHAVEWLPDLPVRLRVGPDDHMIRAVGVSAGMEHVPELDHTADDDEWQVLELPYIRVVDHVPARAREALLDMWVRVNGAGGAVGFAPGADREDVAALLDGYIDRLAEGRTVCVSLNSPMGELLGFGFVARSTGQLMGHCADLQRVMTDPERRGTNHGGLLMAGMHRAARELGVELVTLDHRDGTGLGDFYARFGYVEVGRIPGAIRVAKGDDRDSVLMARRLDVPPAEVRRPPRA